jgi:hypothetical protein
MRIEINGISVIGIEPSLPLISPLFLGFPERFPLFGRVAKYHSLASFILFRMIFTVGSSLFLLLLLLRFSHCRRILVRLKNHVGHCHCLKSRHHKPHLFSCYEDRVKQGIDYYKVQIQIQIQTHMEMRESHYVYLFL